MSEWVGRIVVFALSVALFVATEAYFPLDENAGPSALKQKHFWATMLFIFSLILGLPVEGMIRLEREVQEVKTALDKHEGRSEAHDRFHETYDEYAAIFSEVPTTNNQKAERLLKAWGDGLIDYLKTDFKSKSIPLPLEQAPGQIKEVYQEAVKSIIATNVGGTKTYFESDEYIGANKYALTRHIPVIRFYLYDDGRKKHILMHDDRAPTDIHDFLTEVRALHQKMGTTYSVVVDVGDSHISDYRDLLLMDNVFLAQTKILPTTWDPIRAEATIDSGEILKARNYLNELRLAAHSSKNIVKMSDSEVGKNYPGYRTADNLFKSIMDEICGPI